MCVAGCNRLALSDPGGSIYQAARALGYTTSATSHHMPGTRCRASAASQCSKAERGKKGLEKAESRLGTGCAPHCQRGQPQPCTRRVTDAPLGWSRPSSCTALPVTVASSRGRPVPGPEWDSDWARIGRCAVPAVTRTRSAMHRYTQRHCKGSLLPFDRPDCGRSQSSTSTTSRVTVLRVRTFAAAFGLRPHSAL